MPPEALLHQPMAFVALVTLAGLLGVLSRKQKLVTLASLGLLSALIWGKMATNIFKTSPPDTALLLFQFIVVLFFMEASATIFFFDWRYNDLKAKGDELSHVSRERLLKWMRVQLLGQTRLMLAAFGLSLSLLLIASFTSVSSNQLVFSAILALLSVIALLFLAIYRREP